jgi:hypothetical protein
MNEVRTIEFMGNPLILGALIFVGCFFWPLMIIPVIYFVSSLAIVRHEVDFDSFQKWRASRKGFW